MAAPMLYYHSTVSCTCKGGISASTICHHYRYILVFDIYVGLNRLPLAASMAYPLHSSFLRHECSQ